MSKLVKCPKCGKLVELEDYSSHKCNSNPPKPDYSIHAHTNRDGGNSVKR